MYRPFDHDNRMTSMLEGIYCQTVRLAATTTRPWPIPNDPVNCSHSEVYVLDACT